MGIVERVDMYATLVRVIAFSIATVKVTFSFIEDAPSARSQNIRVAGQ